jgi:hypothetical protein
MDNYSFSMWFFRSIDFASKLIADNSLYAQGDYREYTVNPKLPSLTALRLRQLEFVYVSESVTDVLGEQRCWTLQVV